jgi:hypothetical protein
MDVELALKINRLIHNECKDVPHDIGFRIVKLIDKQKAAISDTRCCETFYCNNKEKGYENSLCDVSQCQNCKEFGQ